MGHRWVGLNQIPDHAARVVAAAALAHARQRLRQRPRQPDTIRSLRQQTSASMGHQTLSVRRDIYGEKAFSTHHPQGDLHSSGSRTFSKPKNPGPTGRQAPRLQRGAWPLTNDPGQRHRGCVVQVTCSNVRETKRRGDEALRCVAGGERELLAGLGKPGQ